MIEYVHRLSASFSVVIAGLLGLGLSLPSGSLQAQNDGETYALLAELFQSLDGDNWHRRDGWVYTDIVFCEWYGISCVEGEEPPRIARLELPGNRLVGQIRAELLDELNVRDSIDLSGNQIDGPMPRLPARTYRVDLSRNQLSGPLIQNVQLMLLPSPFRDATLRHLDLSGNALSGRIPNHWNSLSLDYLDLSDNALDDGIQNAFAAMGNPWGAYLNLAGNRFSGELPPAVMDTILWPADLPLEGGGLNLCFNDLEISSDALAEWIDQHHVGGESWPDCLGLERLAVDLDLNGSWFNPERPEEGMSLQLLGNDTALIHWLGQDLDGNQQWLFEVVPVGDDWLGKAELLETRGFFGEGIMRDRDGTPRLRPAMRLRLDRIADDRLHVERSVYDWRGCAPLEAPPAGPGDPVPMPCPIFAVSDRFDLLQRSRLAGARCDRQHPAQRLSGTWFLQQAHGEGIVVDIVEDGRVLVTWVTYTADGSGRQMWLSGLGELEGDNTLVVASMMRPKSSAPAPDQLVADPSQQVWGSLRLSFNEDGLGALEFQSLDPEFSSGEASIERLTQPALPECGDAGD